MFGTYLRFHTFTLTFWAGLMLLWAAMIGVLYESVGSQVGFAEAYENMPAALKAAAGFDEESFAEGLITVEGYLAAELYSWWPLILAIYAVIYGAGAVAGEAERGTAELVLVQPIPRSRFLLSKFGVFLVGLGVVGLMTVAGVEVGFILTGNEISLKALLLTQAQAWAVAAAIGSYTFAFSALTLSYRATLAWAGGITVLQYLWDLVTASVDALKPLSPITLFDHYHAFRLLNTGAPAYADLAVALGVAATGLTVALVAFQRKDIAA